MKKVTFKKITIQNFLSIGEDPVVIDFNTGLNILVGKNRDKPDRKNAAGKSTIADAIYFAIFGDSLRDIKKDLIINNVTGGKAQVELEFTVDSPKGCNNFHIVRTINPTKVFITKDGIDKTRDSIANTTKYICDVLSASQAVFQNCVIMTVNNATPFMAKNKVEKRKFIEDIFGMEVFSKMISTLRAEYNEVKKEYDIQQSRYEEIQKTLIEYTTQKNRALDKKYSKQKLYEERFDNNKKEIEELAAKLEKLKSQHDILTIKQEIESLEQTLVECDSSIHDLIESSTDKKAKVAQEKEKFFQMGSDKAKCPTCLKLITDHDKEAIAQEKQDIKSNIKVLVDGISTILKQIQTEKDRKSSIKDNISQKNEELSNLNIELQSKVSIEERLVQLNQWQLELTHDIKHLKSDETEFDDLIKSINDRIDIAQTTMNEITKKLSKLDVVKFVVSEEGVKSYIVNKLLELLNSKLYFYLKRLDSNSVCVFNEYFEEEIVNEKNKICSYFNFSGAERKSIDLACLFAFSDIRRIQGGVSYNIAIYDELFDSSFDDKGIELITDILQERVSLFDECSIVISHRKESLKAVTGDIICLEKRDGITRRVDYFEE